MRRYLLVVKTQREKEKQENKGAADAENTHLK